MQQTVKKQKVGEVGLGGVGTQDTNKP